MATVKVFNIIFILIVRYLQLSQAIYPDTRCSLDDSPCLTDQAQKTLKEFVQGVPELGIKPLENFPIDHVVGVSDNFVFNWTNVIVKGLKDAVIDKVSINMELKTMSVLFHTDIVLEFDSLLDGVLLSVLPANGIGRGDLTLKNIQIEMLFIFDIKKDKNDKDVMDLKKYYYGVSTADGIAIRLENLYNGDKKKSDQYHKIVNESWRIMFTNFGEFFQRKITVKIFDAVKLFMNSRPLEELALYE